MTGHRWTKRRFGVVAAVLTLVLPSVPVGTGAAAAPVPASGPGTGSTGRTTGAAAGPAKAGTARVTLITGDVVTLVDTGGPVPSVSVRPARRPDGREPAFQVRGRQPAGQSSRSSLFVVPEDAQPLIRSGRIDPLLFDVQLLRRLGGGTIPAISGFTGVKDARRLSARGEGLAASTLSRPLTSIGAAAVKVPAGTAAQFWRDVTTPASTARTATLDQGISRIWLDRPVEVNLDRSVQQINAPRAWAAGYDGTGVTVAVLDTGVDSTHPDLAGKVTEARNFTTESSATDGHGHGTHVASIIAGSGQASEGRRKGAAPGVRLLAGKVLRSDGGGLMSDVIAGMEWAADSGARVVNLSLGGPAQPTDVDANDPAVQALEFLTKYTGTLFVVAGGNSGPDPVTIGSPGVARSALTVGAVDHNDAVTAFSSRGPLPYDYPRTLKPDLTAPGAAIAAARATGTAMGTPVDEHYTRASGTSMATPHVAAAAAIVAQRHPDWTAQQLKAALTGSASVLPGESVYAQGAGRVDVAAAVGVTVTAGGPLDFGRAAEPTRPELSRVVTYTNHTAAPVELGLRTELRNDTTGEQVPADALTGPAAVTVPANGTASVTYLLRTGDLTVGAYAGRLVATLGTGAQVAAAIAFTRERETVDVIVPVTGRGNEPCVAGGSYTQCSYSEISVLNLDDPSVRFDAPAVTGGVRLRLPKGRYQFSANVSFPLGATTNVAVLVKPEVTVAGPALVQLALASARQITARTDRPSENYAGTLIMTRNVPAGSAIGGWIAFYHNANLWALPSEQVTVGDYLLVSDLSKGAVPLTARVTSGERTQLHPRYATYARLEAKFPARVTAPLVDVGSTLEPAEAAKLKGAIALVMPPYVPILDTYQCCLTEAQVAALEAAGAIGALVYSPAASGSVPDAFPLSQTLPVAGLPSAEGAELHVRLGREPVTIRLDSVASTPYQYSLRFYEQGKVSEDLSYQVTDAELAAIASEDRFDGSGTELSHRYALGLWRSSGENYGITSSTGHVVPTALEQLIGPARAGQEWYRWNDLGVTNHAGFRLARLQPGRHPAEVWNAAPRTHGAAVAHEVLTKACTACRSGNTLHLRPTGTWPDPTVIDNTQLAPGAYLVGSAPHTDNFGPTEYQVHDGDTLLPLAGKKWPNTAQYAVPPGERRLRVVHDRDVPATPGVEYGRKARTEWSFVTKQPFADNTSGSRCLTSDAAGDHCSIQPLLQLRYAVALDERNRAARSGALVTLTAYRETSTDPAVALRALQASVSFDSGRTWTPLAVRGQGSTRTVQLPKAPTGATAVSLRTAAVDRAGSQVTQEVIDAFGLR